MLTNKEPFEALTYDEYRNKIEEGRYNLPPINLTLVGFTFLNKCLQYQPADRYSLSGMLNSAYLEYAAPSSLTEVRLIYSNSRGSYVKVDNDYEQSNPKCKAKTESLEHKLDQYNSVQMNIKDPEVFQSLYNKYHFRHHDRLEHLRDYFGKPADAPMTDFMETFENYEPTDDFMTEL